MFSELVKRNSRRSRRENGLFFASLLIAIIAFYIILSLSHQDVIVFLKTMESDAVNRLLTLVPVLYGLTLFILFFLVYYANRFQLARRRHEFGVYFMLGMQRRKLFGMLLAEDLRSSLIALAIGLPAAVLISELISLVTARLVGLGIVGHQFTLSLSAIGWTAVGFLAIKLLASLILSGKIVRQEIGALLTETPEGTKKQRPAAVYAAALVLGAALLAGAYTFAILGYAWSSLRYMANTIALGVAGTLLLFYGLRVIIDRLARRGDRAGKLRVFNFRQVEETVIHRSGTLAISSLLILAALCCFGAGVATARSSRAETHTLDYTFRSDGQSLDDLRRTLAAGGLDSAFSDIFEMRIGRVRTSTDYQNTVKFPALQRTIDAMPASDEQQQLQYLLEAVGYPHLIALSSYNRLLDAAGLPELTLAPDEAAVYCDSEVSSAENTALLDRLITDGAAVTIDGAPFTLTGQVQSVSVVTDRSITISFALIVPDAAFDRYTQGDYDVYLNAVLAPSATEGKSLMRAIADMNEQLDPLGLEYESYLQSLGRELFYIVAASYLTIYLAIIFLVVANTVIGVQFLMGQQKAARRYRTLVRLGAEHDTLCRAAKAQINWYFGLPVGVAAVSSLFGVRALFSGILSASAQSGMTEMMIAAGAMILLLCVVEWIYMAAVKRSSSKYLLTLMAPEREE
ncbi:MAG: FtsX-like permease family protein [Oscillospiraceae bacterium]